MEQIKLKTFTAETLELLEKNINAFLSSEEATVKSRLLCKMLYNVFTISTYQN